MGKTSYHCKDGLQGLLLSFSPPGTVCLSPVAGTPASSSPRRPGVGASVAPSAETSQPVYAAGMLPENIFFPLYVLNSIAFSKAFT